MSTSINSVQGDYTPTIGLEVHAELRTKTKMFCDSRNDPDEIRPNVNICPVCMAHPGTLPVINKEAVKHVLKVGVAFGSKLADFTEFDRKNYFYPDIPKGYQISQYKLPLVSGGSLNGVALTRVHLEEDTARSVHDEKLAGADYTLLDFNRAGVPLMELVTEPVIHDAKTAGDFARELQLVLRYLGASEANMEKGQMRVEANISVSKDPAKFGTKVEVKNLNSFRSVERAIEYEIARHIKVLEEGGTIAQETRGWDEAKQATYSQRSKESAHDYRYFPDPDLPKLVISEIPEFSEKALRGEIKDRNGVERLPWVWREKLAQEYGLNEEHVSFFIDNPETYLAYLSDILALVGEKAIKLAAGHLATDFSRLTEGDPEKIARVPLEQFAEIIRMRERGELSSNGATDLIKCIFEKGGDATVLAAEHGLLQKSDAGELQVIVEKIVAENGKVVSEYRAGKTASLQFLIGQGMKASRGSANPQVLKELFEKILK